MEQPNKHDVGYLRQMEQAAQKITRWLHGVDPRVFAHDAVLQDGVIWQLEVLGDAAGRVSEAFRMTHPIIDWNTWFTRRQHLISHYDAIDLDEVWHTAFSAVPLLQQKLTDLTPG